MNKSFGKYTLNRLIGEGGYGKVYLAHDTLLNQSVALKILPTHNDNKTLQRFLQERDMISQLSHQHIVQINDSGKIDETYFIDLEYIQGGSLADHIQKKGRMPLKAACTLVSQISNALHYAHQNNIIHRDVKPENILIDSNFTPYITDFGIAKYHQVNKRLSRTGSFMGTPHFMAPEQMINKHIDHRCDIYGLGSVLFYCLTGRAPFEDYKSYILYSKKINTAYPKPPSTYRSSIPPDLDKICLKALANTKERRYKNMHLFQKDIEKYLEGKKLDIIIQPQRIVDTIKMYKVPCILSTLLLSGIMTFNLISYTKNEQVYTTTQHLQQVVNEQSKIAQDLKARNKSLQALNTIISIKNNLQNNIIDVHLDTPEKIDTFYTQIESLLTDKKLLYATWAANYYKISQRTIIREDVGKYLAHAHNIIKKAITLYPDNEALIYQGYLYYTSSHHPRYVHLQHLPNTTTENKILKQSSAMFVKKLETGTNEYDKEIESLLLSAIKTETKNFVLYEQIGFFYSEQNETLKARKYLKASLLFEPDNFYVHRQLALNYLAEIRDYNLTQPQIKSNYIYSARSMETALNIFRQGTMMNYYLAHSYFQLALLTPKQELYYLNKGYTALQRHTVTTPIVTNRERYHIIKLDIAIKIAKLTNKHDILYHTVEKATNEIMTYYKEYSYDTSFLQEAYSIKGHLEEKKQEYAKAANTYTLAVKVCRYIKNSKLEKRFKSLLDNCYKKLQEK